jgi:IS30 family transposase
LNRLLYGAHSRLKCDIFYGDLPTTYLLVYHNVKAGLMQQITDEQRYIISFLRGEGRSVAQIAKALKRHRSTIDREIRRNKSSDGRYQPHIADQMALYRRSKSRRNSYFEAAHWKIVVRRLNRDWSPEQISLKLAEQGKLHIHWETIYRYIWADKERGGFLHLHLRQAPKQRRKRNGSHDSRGRLPGKRPIGDRPLEAEQRMEWGHFEIDLVHGFRGRSCVMTLVDRKTRFTHIEKLKNKTTEEVNAHLIPLIKRFGIKTITSDNGCEFHAYEQVEQQTAVRFYFATPHHSWERGTSENTNGLIRQYMPKWHSMRYTNQAYCDSVSRRLNTRPRKILGLKTPEECYYAEAA